jgi:hypothetical protein
VAPPTDGFWPQLAILARLIRNEFWPHLVPQAQGTDVRVVVLSQGEAGPRFSVDYGQNWAGLR